MHFVVILFTMFVAIQTEKVYDSFHIFRQPKVLAETTAATPTSLASATMMTMKMTTNLTNSVQTNNSNQMGDKSASTSITTPSTTMLTTTTTTTTKTRSPISTSTKKIVRTKSNKTKQQSGNGPTIGTTTKMLQQTTQQPQVATTIDNKKQQQSDSTASSAVTFKGSVTAAPTNNAKIKHFPNTREKLKEKISANISQNLLPLPNEAEAALVKPTKYHYYPHNQHIYLLPECAIQQVCNAVYVRLNWTQPLCACPSRYKDPCSASLNSDDLHTTELIIDRSMKRALTLVKTCEPTADMRLCRTPRDWSLLALQNIRTGKSHYLVICRCPETSILEGPMSHDQPTYASVPGIKVYGMMCVNVQREGRPLRIERSYHRNEPNFPWDQVQQLIKNADWDSHTVI